MDEPRDTRQRILDVCLDLFSQHGYAATSMRQVARAVGVRESAIYSHFKSKQEILDTLFGLYGPGSIASKITAITDASLTQDAKGTFKALLFEMVDIWMRTEELKFFRLGLMEAILSNDAASCGIQASVQLARQKMRSVFERLQKLGVIEEVDPEFLLVEFMGPVMILKQDLTLFRCVPDARERLRIFCESHVEFFFSRIMGHKEKSR